MNNKRNLISHLLSLCILVIGFLLTRFVLFDIHGMKEWPFILFIIGLLIIVISYFTKTKQVATFTAVSYIGGFVVGLIFQTDKIGTGGTMTNNLWIIWTVVYVCFVLAAVINEIIVAMKKKI